MRAPDAIAAIQGALKVLEESDSRAAKAYAVGMLTSALAILAAQSDTDLEFVLAGVKAEYERVCQLMGHGPRPMSLSSTVPCSDCGLPIGGLLPEHNVEHPGICCDCFDERQGMPAEKRTRPRPASR